MSSNMFKCVHLCSNLFKTYSSVIIRPLRDPGISRDPGIFSKSRSRNSQKSNPGIFQDFQKPLNDCILRLSTPIHWPYQLVLRPLIAAGGHHYLTLNMTMTLIGQGVWLFSRETQIQEVGRHPTKGLSPERDLTWGQLHYRPLYRALTFWFPGTTKAYIQLEGIHSVGSQETT